MTRVLIVDDDRDTTDSFRMLLARNGYRTSTANSGEDALALAETELPDIVLLDIGLQDLSGHEVCRRLRMAPWGVGLHIIVVSGWTTERHKQEALAAGCDTYLIKPVPLDTLLQTLRSAKRRGPLGVPVARAVPHREVRLEKAS